MSHTTVNFFYWKQRVTVKLVIVLNHMKSFYFVCEVSIGGLCYIKIMKEYPLVALTYYI